MSGSISIPTNGRGPSPSLLPLNIDAIPQELRDLPQWVTWRVVHKPGAPKPTKLPLNPRTGEAASTTDPATWGTFDEALAAFHSGIGDGIGFVFSPDDPYTGVDLDGCYEPEAGALASWTQDIIPLLSTYTELSVFGHGLHLILKGQIPGPRRRQGPIEMYSEGRFFTMTGCRLEGTLPEVAHRSAELKELYQRVFGETLTRVHNEEPAGPGTAPPILPDDDDELVQRALEARNGDASARLWRGDWQGYSSQSEADLALCSHLAFWTRGDELRMDRLFRRSGLYREKWDETHGAQTYGQMTMAKARSTNRSIARAQAGQEVMSPDELNSFPLTDAGNAEVFAHLYGHRLRYDHARHRWLLWEEHRWAPDGDGEVYRLTKAARPATWRP